MTTENRLALLTERMKRCCCCYCGGNLEIRRLEYSENDNARIELYCANCGQIEFGVEREIYNVAKYYVEDMGFLYYEYGGENIIKQNQMNIAKAAEMMSWAMTTLGLITEKGFIVPITVPEYLQQESLNIKLPDFLKLVKKEWED